MIRLAILYASAIGIPALVLIGRSLNSGADHWPLFGTLLDQWIQRLGIWGVVLAVFPLVLLTGIAARRRYRRGSITGACLTVAIGVVAYVLFLPASD